MIGKNVGFFINICSPKNLALIILELQEEAENGWVTYSSDELPNFRYLDDVEKAT